jgi:beta-phosphoglucomutase-like phosphatase (HAD superfamily)
MRSLPEAVIFSFSGTLVDTSSISHLVAGHHPACDAPASDRFQLETMTCPPVRQIAQLLKLERSIGRTVLLVSADRDHYRPHLQTWLDLNGLSVNAIHLRRVSDHRPDALTKAEIVAGLQERYSIVHAYDDRADVARAYQRLGIDTTLTGGAAVSRRRPAAA